MKKIALDLDGVVFDTENLYRVYTEIYDVEHFKSDNIIDNTSRMFQNRYSWNEKDFTDFYNIYSQEIIRSFFHYFHFPSSRCRVKFIKISTDIFIHFHNSSFIGASITIIRG